MRWAAAAKTPVSFEQLTWISACLALALAAHVTVLPLWLLATVCAAGLIRLGSAARGHTAPPRAIRMTIAGAGVVLLFVRFHTFNGLEAGTALLCLMAGLKLLETQSRRDLYIITLIIYFLNLAALLQSESFWLLSYLIGISWLATAGLLRLSNASPLPGWRNNWRLVGRILVQALPLALVLWLFFPRFYEPLWRLPAQSRGAESGLSDTMSPGDITELALSDEIAFRVHFAGAVPSPRERYWRGPVLHDFDGHTWRRTDAGVVRAPPLVHVGGEYRYRLSLEPHAHNWVFALDWPASWDQPRAQQTSDYMLVEPAPVSQSIDVLATSYSHVRAAESLSPGGRRRDTWLPPGRNPRALEFAQRLHDAHPDEMAYVGAVLDMFRVQPFYYTLTPPALQGNSVDGFLFDTKRGYCGHYASAFAVLMRAVGIPTRVVTGYQGGTFNRFADYWIVRQSDAHAWDEIWVEGRGWLRIDPTSAVAPERVERDFNELVARDQPLASRWHRSTPLLADMRLRLDALHQLWRDRILQFNQNAQVNLLLLLRMPNPDGQKLVLVLAIGFALALAWLTWQVRRELQPDHTDKVVRAYAILCRKLARVGLPRSAHEGPEDYAARVARERPDLAAAVSVLCGDYARLRYGARHPDAEDSNAARPNSARQAFIADVRSFRPQAARTSPKQSTH